MALRGVSEVPWTSYGTFMNVETTWNRLWNLGNIVVSWGFTSFLFLYKRGFNCDFNEQSRKFCGNNGWDWELTSCFPGPLGSKEMAANRPVEDMNHHRKIVLIYVMYIYIFIYLFIYKGDYDFEE